MTPDKRVEEIAYELLWEISAKSNCGCGGYIDYDIEVPKVIQALTQHHQDRMSEVVEKTEKEIFVFGGCSSCDSCPCQMKYKRAIKNTKEDVLTIIKSPTLPSRSDVR